MIDGKIRFIKFIERQVCNCRVGAKKRTGILLVIFSLVLPLAVAQAAPATVSVNKHAVERTRFAALVGKFKSNEAYYLTPKFKEKQTRERFIDEFFAVLGWDVRNDKKVFLYLQDTIPETRLKIGRSMHYADYGFKIDARAVFYCEAKAAHVDIDDPKYIFQAKRYAWSSTRAELVILTDFETLRVYDCRIRPDIDKPEEGELKQFRMSYRDYPQKFNLLWDTFSKEAVSNASISALLKDTNPNLERIAADKAFISDLDKFRLQLGRDIHQRNQELSTDRLNEAAQHILNTLLFARILEDRDIEPTGRLREALSLWEASDKKRPLFYFLQEEFKNFQKRYNGVIFQKHFADKLQVGNTTLREIIELLYPPRSPYQFSVIPFYVLGKAYEHSLGRRLELKDGKVSLATKPEVRKSGGVFYTPEWVIQYIVSQTLDKKLAGKTVVEMGNIKTLDIACGSGAFTVELADKLLSYARDYYARHPKAIQGEDSEFPDAYLMSDGSIKLSIRKKAELIQNSIFAMDVDPQAVEITKMWLYILMLDREGSPVVTRERRYKIPNRTWSEKIVNFKLPNLDQNILCANALVGLDFSSDAGERQRVRVFDWKDYSSKIAAVAKAGGFDVIVGNPPYMSFLDMKKFIPDQLNYLRSHYLSMSYKQVDLYYAFIEKGLELLNKEGYLGYIISNRFLYTEAGAKLRNLIAKGKNLHELIDFGTSSIFEDVIAYTAITILRNANNETFKYAKVSNTKHPDEVVEHLSNTTHEGANLFVRQVGTKRLSQHRWGFPVPSKLAVFNAITKQPLHLQNIAESFAGLVTGIDAVFVVKLLQCDGTKALIQSRSTGKSHWIEQSILRPLVRSRDIHRYKPPQNKVWLIWPYDVHWNVIPERELKMSHPLAYAYFVVNKERLLKRSEKYVPWYELHRPRKQRLMQHPKLLSGWRKGDAQFSIDLTGESLFTGSGRSAAVVTKENAPSLESLLGVLNSSLVKLYVHTISPELQGGHAYDASILDTIPIVPLTEQSKPLYNAIGRKVKELLVLHTKNEIKEIAKQKNQLESEIDTLVERLYGIFPKP